MESKLLTLIYQALLKLAHFITQNLAPNDFPQSLFISTKLKFWLQPSTSMPVWCLYSHWSSFPQWFAWALTCIANATWPLTPAQIYLLYETLPNDPYLKYLFFIMVNIFYHVSGTPEKLSSTNLGKEECSIINKNMSS